MGKRELFIIAGFAAAGLIAFQFSTPATADARRFSLRTFLADLRRGDSATRVSTSVTHRGVIPAPTGLHELRLSNTPRLMVSGESRTDIAYELRVDATGPNTQTARQTAENTTLARDDLGRVLALRVVAPTTREARQTTHLTLHVPARLVVRLEGAPRAVSVDIRRVAGVELDGLVGDVHLESITDAVNGSQRNGDLTLAGAGSVRLTLDASNATIADVAGPIVLAARNGRCRIRSPRGPLDLDSTAADAEVVEPLGAVRIRGSGGSILVDRPSESITVDMRMATLDIRLHAPVAVTAFTTVRALQLTVPREMPFVLDARATNGGTLQFDGFEGAFAGDDPHTSVQRAIGDGKIPIALRNDRGLIVIGQRK